MMLALRISLQLTCGLFVTFNICDYMHLGVSIAAVFLTTLSLAVKRMLLFCSIFTCKTWALCSQETGENAFDSQIYGCAESILIPAAKYIHLGCPLIARKAQCLMPCTLYTLVYEV